jgi:N-sulfoglucosamine sulfohydrolase
MRFLLPALAVAFALPAVAADRKNVVVLIADDLGMELGCYGDKTAKTPNLDKLAAGGTRFTNAFASVASCSPSRATMLTGMPTHQCGQYGLAHATHNQHSFRSVKGLPALLAPAGYKTGVVGKLHVQPKEVFPWDAEVPDGGRNPVSMANKARKFIEDAGDKPFFLWLGYTDPHRAAKGFANDANYPESVPAVKFDPKTVPLPYHLPDTPETRAEVAEYYQSVARLDHGVGLVLKLLDDMKLAENTLVVFLSDNGIPFPGAKTTLYDSGVHLPLIVRKPGQKQTVSEAMVSWTDLAPSILDWCGVKPPEGMKGKSWLPILEQPTADGWDAVYGSHQFHEVTMYYPMRMVRTRTHKLILNLAHPLEYPFASDLWGSDVWQGVLKRGDKLMGRRAVKAFLHRPAVELYDVAADPNELKNRADDPKLADVRKELEAKLAAWRKATADPWLVKDRHE